jgi:DNA modification methylase
MMAEKVTIGNCELWHGDCREVLPLLPPVDLVLTDPPYGIGRAGQQETFTKGTSLRQAARLKRYMWNGMLQQDMKNKEEREHPTQKPVPVMRWALMQAKDVKTVCDPFMGSGTTGVACVMEGLQFVGIERERKYFDIACRRIEQAYAQPRLLEDAKPAAAVQGDMLLPANDEAKRRAVGPSV